MAAFRSTSLRAQLSLTYAGIALLTAVLLGGILLSVLGGYYARAETAYLQAAAIADSQRAAARGREHAGDLGVARGPGRAGAGPRLRRPAARF